MSRTTPIFLVVCSLIVVGVTTAKSTGLPFKHTKVYYQTVSHLQDVGGSKSREVVGTKPAEHIGDLSGDWIGRPFDVVEEEQYIGPNNGEFVPEQVGDGRKIVPESLVDSARQPAFDWGFLDHDNKPLEIADFDSKGAKDGQISGGHWGKKRKSK